MRIEEIIRNLRKRQLHGDERWPERAVKMLEAIMDSGINPLSNPEHLLDEMIKVKDDPKVSAYLASLPSVSEGNRNLAETQLGYLTILIRRACHFEEN